MCLLCLAESTCLSTVSATCVTTEVGGKTLSAVLTDLQTQITATGGSLKTTTLVPRTFTTSQVSTPLNLFQALIDKVSAITPTSPVTVASLLAEPIVLQPGCNLPACGGSSAQSVSQILLNLLSQVEDLKIQLAALRAVAPQIPPSY